MYEIQATFKPVAKPAAKSAAKPAAKSAVKPAANSTKKPAAKVTAQPFAKLNAKTATKPTKENTNPAPVQTSTISTSNSGPYPREEWSMPDPEEFFASDFSK